MSSVDLKNSVTSSIPSMNTNERTFENWFWIAYTSISVKRAKAATEPEMFSTVRPTAGPVSADST